MVPIDAIDSALNAHAVWKKRLKDAIAKGTSEFNVEVVKKDNACQFGQWLYSLSTEDKSSKEFSDIRDLHSEFHKTAAEILDLALHWKKEEAQKKLEPGGGYSNISGKLILALARWKSKL